MKGRRSILLALGALAVGGLVILSLPVNGSPQVMLKHRGFAIKQFDSGPCPVAVLELTNGGTRTINYLGYATNSPLWSRLHQTPSGWEEPKGEWLCGVGLERFTLAPAQSAIFEVPMRQSEVCMVRISYSDNESPNSFWRGLPNWLRDRLPWASGWSTANSTATSEIIDAHQARGMPQSTEQDFTVQEEGVLALKMAALAGNGNAQLRLAGKYWTGDGIGKSIADAIAWYQSAVTNGNAEAAYNLGSIYDYGLGVGPDKFRAIEYYRAATEHGQSNATERLRQLSAN